ncbi:MAG: biotin/lipoyl-binding protein [Phycisphaeraceae bacterium]|nr:MAG: biotin/lipoyl-binding protein [Phycisphaeraceae bacterium]
MSKRSRVLTWGLPAVGLATLVVSSFAVILDRPVRLAEQPPRQPTTAPTEPFGTDSRAFIGAIGVVEPPDEAIQIAAHVPGVVESLLVGLGDRVEAGQPLLRIDTRRAARKVDRRRAALQLAEAELEALRAQVTPAMARVESAKASVAAAEAALTTVRAELDDRRNRLRIAESIDDPRAIASEEIDARRFAVQRAEGSAAEAQSRIAQVVGSLAEAEAELSLLQAGDQDGPDVRAAAARVAQAASELAAAETDLELATVRSPIDAVVIQRNIRVGEFAEARSNSAGILTLSPDGPKHIRVQIDEVDIPRFNPDAKAIGSPRGNPGLRIPLTLAYVEPLVVAKTNLSGRTSELIDTRVLRVVYEFPDETGGIVFGQQIDVYIEAAPIGEGS